MGGLIDNVNQVLRAHIQAREENASVISGNIANAETPGFKPKELDFERLVESRLNEDDEEGAVLEEVQDRIPGANGNAVALHKQMANLADNAISQQAAIKMLNKRLDILRFAIRDGG